MYIGIDIGGTKCAVVLGDENGNIIKKKRISTSDCKSTIKNLTDIVKEMSDESGVISAGVSCGGPLDEKNGIILSPPNLPGWDRVFIKKIIEETAGVPCFVRNDANACAIAEWKFGAGKGTENMVFITFGTGLGAGIIINGRLYSGANGYAGEIGHIRLEHFGVSGYGKAGSFEGFCSGAGLSEMGRIYAREAIQNGYTPEWAKAGLEKISVPKIADYARMGEKTALKIFNICGEKLGFGLSVIIDIINPEKIIIGSIYARCKDLLDPAMYRVIREEAIPAASQVCSISAPELGENIGDMAALAVAMEVNI